MPFCGPTIHRVFSIVEAPGQVATRDESQGPEPTDPSLKSLAIRGSVWTVVSYGGSQVLRLGSSLVLTRLLFPEAFGLMTLVNVFMQGLTMFSDVGIGPSIIQSKRGDDPRFLNTAWTIQVFRGIALWVCACALAYPVASFYGMPMLASVLPISGAVAIIAGFNSTALFTLNRRLAIGKIALLDLSAQILALVVMVVWAIVDRSVWALVAGGLTGALAKMVLTHLILQNSRCRFHWDKEASRSLLSFGKWIFISTLTTFLAGQSDRLAFGKMFSTEMLGVYSIALMLALTPVQVILKVGSMVVFPTYSKLVRTAGSLSKTFHTVRHPLLLLGAALVSLLAACGPAFVYLLYDERYHEAGRMIQLLTGVAWFQILECTNGSALLAMGKPYWVAGGNVSKLIGMAALIPFGYILLGLQGAILGLLGAEVLKYSVSSWGTWRNELRGFPRDIMLTLIVLVAAVGGALLSMIVRDRWQSDLGAFAVAAIVVGGGWGWGLLRSNSVRRMFGWT